jgi:hypothetical protein
MRKFRTLAVAVTLGLLLTFSGFPKHQSQAILLMTLFRLFLKTKQLPK